MLEVLWQTGKKTEINQRNPQRSGVAEDKDNEKILATSSVYYYLEVTKMFVI